MKAFVFDTETTWFTVKWWTSEEQPYIVQFAWILWEISKEDWFIEISRINRFVKPRISIPFSASQVHGIYDKDVINAPYIEEVIDDFLKFLNTTDIIVGHNVEFDEEIIRNELIRLGRPGDYQPMKTICTMRWSTEFCQLQWRWFWYKPPKLNELYRKLFGNWFEWAHDAMVDVEATSASFWELIKKWVITLEENNLMRLF